MVGSAAAPLQQQTNDQLTLIKINPFFFLLIDWLIHLFIYNIFIYWLIRLFIY